MADFCRFKDSQKHVTRYLPADVKAFRIKDSRYFISRNINNSMVFLEFLVEGEINIFYMRDENGDHYYIENENEGIREIPYKSGTIYSDDSRRFYESNAHIGVLTYYTRDVPELESNIQSIKKPGQKNLISLARDYHQVVCQDGKCLTYEKKLKYFKASVQPFSGITSYGGYKNTMVFGSYLLLWIPGSNEKVFLKTGIAYLTLSDEGEKLRLYKLPIQIQYIYRAFRLQPEISAGINVLRGNAGGYRELGHVLSLNAGLNFKITPMTSLCAGVESEYTPIISKIINKERFRSISQSVIVGLRIDL